MVDLLQKSQKTLLKAAYPCWALSRAEGCGRRTYAKGLFYPRRSGMSGAFPTHIWHGVDVGFDAVDDFQPLYCVFLSKRMKYKQY
jgi:hypothetical protein